MNRRTFFATLFAAPLAAVAVLNQRESITVTIINEGYEVTYTPSGPVHWSHARSTPIADIEEAKRKLLSNYELRGCRGRS